MDKKAVVPKTLVEAIRYFADPDRCLSFLVAQRWPKGVVTCPSCGSKDVTFLAAYRRWKCHTAHPRQQFSIKVGTIFEDSPVGLDKWLPALWMLVNDKNGISSYEVARALGVTQKTAWFMLHRIRLAMQDGGSVVKMRGEVEVDETYIGGSARFMHAGRRAARIKSTGPAGKVAVMGMLERGPDKTSRVKVMVVPTTRKKMLQSEVRRHVEPGTAVYSDALGSYRGLDAEYLHEVIDHSQASVRGKVHTNGLENFWSLLKRAIKGTYVNVEPYHLRRYIEEQAFRFNERFGKDADRFSTALRSIVGRRLTYKGLIGDASVATTPA